MEHFYDALTEGKADAALAASLFHYKELEIRQVKEYLRERKVPVRLKEKHHQKNIAVKCQDKEAKLWHRSVMTGWNR